jgi:hypothetical protein
MTERGDAVRGGAEGAREPPPETTTDTALVERAHRLYDWCVEDEGPTRASQREDIKFEHADADNGYQWPDKLRADRLEADRPCLTLNFVPQHLLQITNEIRQNPSSMEVVASGNGATKEVADMLDACVKRIEYQSNAPGVYAMAREFQVGPGVGWWRITTEYVPGEFDQEIFLRAVPDPFMVWLDPAAREQTGADAEFGFVEDWVPRERFERLYPRYARRASDATPLGTGGNAWITKDHIRVCEFIYKESAEDELVSFVDPRRGRRTVLASALHPSVLAGVRRHPETRTRPETTQQVFQAVIAGQTVVSRTRWAGRHIPLIRCVGRRGRIDGQLFVKGHTRGLKDAQRMYNFNASGQVEFVALQSKSPFVAPAKAIDGYEGYYATANVDNHAVLPYRHVDEDGQPIPPPQRQPPPTASPAFEAGMTTAFNQAMMVSGQWQNQLGMMGNERTGAAIQGRQAQGDTATYHFRANFEEAQAWSCQQIVELIPAVYDTRRVMLAQGDDGVDYEIVSDPAAREAYLERQAHDRAVLQRVFNPTVGRYDVRARSGDSYGTRRDQTREVMKLLLTQAPALTGVIGDLMLQNMDFKEAQEAAIRLRRMVPPQALGVGPTPQEQQLTQQVQQLTQQLQTALGKLGTQGLRLESKAEQRDINVFKAETDRLAVLNEMMPEGGGPGVTQLLAQLVQDALTDRLGPVVQANAAEVPPAAPPPPVPPTPGARQGRDGAWYLTDPTREGRYLRLTPLVGQGA